MQTSLTFVEDVFKSSQVDKISSSRSNLAISSQIIDILLAVLSKLSIVPLKREYKELTFVSMDSIFLFWSSYVFCISATILYESEETL